MFKDTTPQEYLEKIEGFFKKYNSEEIFEAIITRPETQSMIQKHYNNVQSRMLNLTSDAPDGIKETVDSVLKDFEVFDIAHFTDDFKMILKVHLYEALQSMFEMIGENEEFRSTFMRVVKDTIAKRMTPKYLNSVLEKMEDDLMDFFSNELISKCLFYGLPDELQDLIKTISDSGAGVALGILMPDFSDEDEDDDDDFGIEDFEE